MKTIDSTKILLAKSSVEALKPVSDLISKIKHSDLAYNESAIQKVSKFSEFLESLLSEQQAILNQADALQDNRDEVLINLAFQYVNKIPDRVEGLKKSRPGIEKYHKEKRDELQQKGFSADEINKIIPENQLLEKLSSLEQKVAELKQEEAKLKKFIHDKPFFDTAIIEGTYFYNHFTENEADFRNNPTCQIQYLDMI
ncbi:hypothetical protein AU255_04980 [Methyloprofundus sedimenti]|uniref:Uncharacterized protein n=1 Tax=Methyloprofundus sedimenti TaxID=1420851 RepID=A0A1V8M6W8_9GAMM|nr:hypothetical protein [Methyloprofundus sedimenti]OQK17248.1 hypothetical protein AU255_04980 [Methyloprofundus sedimenti]